MSLFDILKRLMDVSDDVDEVMTYAASGGHIEIVKLCKEVLGAANFDAGMVYAALSGHIEILELCKEWGATDFDAAMDAAAEGGHVEIVKLCKEWGATNIDEAMDAAEAEGDRVEIVKLCREWLGFGLIHRELLQHHHKREFFRTIHDEMLPIAWHPERFWDWCVDEEEKRFLEELWL